MTHHPEEKLQLKAEDVVWREVGDELVVLELSTSTYLTLNGTAKQIWERLASGATCEGWSTSWSSATGSPTTGPCRRRCVRRGTDRPGPARRDD